MSDKPKHIPLNFDWEQAVRDGTINDRFDVWIDEQKQILRDKHRALWEQHEVNVHRFEESAKHHAREIHLMRAWLAHEAEDGDDE